VTTCSRPRPRGCDATGIEVEKQEDKKKNKQDANDPC